MHATKTRARGSCMAAQEHRQDVVAKLIAARNEMEDAVGLAAHNPATLWPGAVDELSALIARIEKIIRRLEEAH